MTHDMLLKCLIRCSMASTMARRAGLASC